MNSLSMPSNTKLVIRSLGLLIALALGMPSAFGHASGGVNRKLERKQPQNVLLVILDDIGVDKIAAYGEHPNPAKTPTIDALASRGVLFRTAWANPFCSPTRATLLTGRYGFRTGIGHVVDLFSLNHGLSIDEFGLPEAMTLATGQRSAILGKWHLGGDFEGINHPLQFGFEVFAGSRGNLGPPSMPESYYQWEKVTEGVSGPSTVYATTDTVNDALTRTIHEELLPSVGTAHWS